MDNWLEWARGPVFRFALALMVLGLLRMLFLYGMGVANSIYRSRDRRLQWTTILQATLKWLLPLNKMKQWPIYTITTLIFHIGLIITPLFLAGHIMLWKRGIGVAWPGLEYGVADALTLLTIFTGIALTIGRIAHPGPRTFQDVALPPLLVVPFFTGFLAMHPGLHPLPYEAVMLVHVLSANLILALIPFTKMAHVVLLPTTLLGELGWSLLSGRGEGELGWSLPSDQTGKAGLAMQADKELS